MALELGSLRAALIEAGASQQKASAAAQEVAGYEKALADVRSDLRLLKWMIGAALAGIGGLLWINVGFYARLGEISGQLALLVQRVMH